MPRRANNIATVSPSSFLIKGSWYHYFDGITPSCTKEKAIVAAKEAAENAELSEAQKQKAIEEYLASQKAKEESSKEEKSNDQE